MAEWQSSLESVEIMINAAFWNGKKVLITGHTGFKGSWLSLWLSMMGAEVYGYAPDPPTDPNLYEIAKVSTMIHSVRGDVRDLPSLIYIMHKAQPEIVIHMAAQPIVLESYRVPVETYEINVMGTVNLLEAVRRTGGVKAIINVTTDKVYEYREWDWGYREGDILGGYDPYSNSKSCSEMVTAAYRNSYFHDGKPENNTAIASARAGNVIGGGDWACDRLIPDCVRSVLSGNKIIVRNPNSIRPWQHVLEALSGYLTLAEHLYEGGQAYAEAWNFGPRLEDCCTVGELVQLFCFYWGENTVYSIHEDEGPHESNFLRLDYSKARLKLGWHPVWDLQKAVAATVEWTKCYSAGNDVVSCMKKQINDYCKGA